MSKTRLISQETIGLLVIIAVGLIIRGVVISVFSHAPESDELAYHSMALNLITGNGIVDSMGNHAMYNVGYPLFILAPLFTLFGEDILIVRFVHGVLGGLSIVLCYAIAKEAGAGKTGRLLAAAMWAFYLPASIYTVYLNKEILMIPLMLGVIWCALRLAKEPTTLTAIVCGVLFGLLALTGNSALSLAAPVILVLVFTSANLARKVSLFLVILLSAVLIATPWVIRNIQVLGAPLLNTNSGINLYLGNNSAATGMFVSIIDTPRGPSWKELHKEGEVKASEILKEEAMAWIKEHPSEFVTLAFKKLAYFWMPPFHKGTEQASGTETIVRILWAIQFFILVIAAIGGVFISRLRSRHMAILWFSIACYTAVHMLFYVIFRYRLPIMPLVCVLAAFSVEYLILRWKSTPLHSKVVIP